MSGTLIKGVNETGWGLSFLLHNDIGKWNLK